MTKEPANGSTQTPSDQEQGAIAVSTHGAAKQNSLRNIRLIIGREYRNRLTQRSFIITSIILLVIVFIAPFIPIIIELVQSHSARSTSQTHVVVVNEAGAVAGMNEASLLAFIGTQLNGTNTPSPAPYAITSQPPSALADVQHQVKQGALDVALVLERSMQGTLQFVYDTDADPTTDGTLSSMQALAQQLTVLDTTQHLGLTPTQTARLFAPASLTTLYPYQSQNARPVGEVAAEYILALAGAILIYVSVGIYGSVVAAGVAEEKSSRVMELLVTVATPFQLLAGKIAGIGAACLTQMGAVVVVGISALLLQAPIQNALFGTSASNFSQFLISVSVPFYALFLVYLLLAFFLYTALYAGLSAMVRRQEEVQNATVVPTMLLLSGYLLFYLVAAWPNADWAKLLSYFPFWTPTLMMVRIARGTVAWWEVATTIGLMLVAIVACTWFAARLYRYGVLMYGQRPGLGKLLQLVRMN